jgi:ATP-dependent DNA ligase
MLQHHASLGRDWQIVYYAFDLLELEGEDLKGRPLSERKKQLQQVISGSEIRYNAELPGSADAIVRTVKEAGLEGVIAKKARFYLSREHAEHRLAQTQARAITGVCNRRL